MIHTGDCLTVMAGMEAESVDAVVTDPPYGLEFMGKGWDKFAGDWGGEGDGGLFAADKEEHPSRKGRKGPAFRLDKPRFHAGHPFQAWCEAWGREALRVTKPGGYLLAFGGTRTHHRLVCGLEDAGWIIRDELDWIYASGFPKGKANLKPAHEPIVLARKPGPLRPLAIDACRISIDETDDIHGKNPHTVTKGGGITSAGLGPTEYSVPQGRWPSNLLLSDPALFDEPNPEVVGSGATARSAGDYPVHEGWTGEGYGGRFSQGPLYGDTGGYSRFFLVPKSARADREPVLRGQLERTANADWPQSLDGNDDRGAAARENSHPTVKPTDLMRHLVRLVTPTGGTVLDPFLGSGTTAIAAELEGFPWVGIEKEPEYVAIAEARLNGVQRGLGLDVPAPTRQRMTTGQQGPTPDTNGQSRWTEWREESEAPEDAA